jgi:hypothetical protein
MQPNTLFVNNLAWATLSEDLQEAFSSCKGFEDAFVMVGRDGRPAGYGFVRFGSEEAAAAAAEVRLQMTFWFGLCKMCLLLLKLLHCDTSVQGRR